MKCYDLRTTVLFPHLQDEDVPLYQLLLIQDQPRGVGKLPQLRDGSPENHR